MEVLWQVLHHGTSDHLQSATRCNIQALLSVWNLLILIYDLTSFRYVTLTYKYVRDCPKWCLRPCLCWKLILWAKKSFFPEDTKYKKNSQYVVSIPTISAFLDCCWPLYSQKPLRVLVTQEFSARRDGRYMTSVTYSCDPSRPISDRLTQLLETAGL